MLRQPLQGHGSGKDFVISSMLLPSPFNLREKLLHRCDDRSWTDRVGPDFMLGEVDGQCMRKVMMAPSRVNVKSMYRDLHHGVPASHQRGGGSIITCSQFRDFEHAECLRLASDEGAIITFTHTLAVDLAKHKIRANTICPGSIITPMRSFSRR